METGPRLSKERQSLLLRMYASPVHVEIARLLGYDAWEYLDARDQLVRLMRRFGVSHILDAAGELVAREVRGRQDAVALKDEVRQFAFGILGRPKPNNQLGHDERDREHGDDELDNGAEPQLRRTPRVPLPDVPENELASDYRRVDETRKIVIERCQQMFKLHGLPCERASKATIPIRPLKTPVAFDLVVKRDEERHLITVRSELTKTQPPQLKRWLDALGPDWRAARMWPIESPQGSNAWLWERDWIEHTQSPTAPSL